MSKIKMEMKFSNRIVFPKKIDCEQNKTKICCTIGPSSNTKEKMKELMEKGMNLARFNFSHSNQEMQYKNIVKLREVMKETGMVASILQDLQGPKIRINKIKNGCVVLKNEEFVTITCDEPDLIGTKERFSCDYSNLLNDAEVGKPIYLNDGKVMLEIVEIKEKEKSVVCKIRCGGKVQTKKGLNLPGIKLNKSCLTKKDLKDFAFGLEKCKMDYVCLSFVRTAQDIIDCHNLMKDKKFNPTGHICPIIAKIETQEAIKNLDSICKTIAPLRGGIIIARGDLAVETGIIRIAILQKEIIKTCNKYGIFSICATDLLRSMIENYNPTRSEICDISNSIFDETSALLLSNESATGKFPIRSVEVLSKVIKQGDSTFLKYRRNDRKKESDLVDFEFSENSTLEAVVFGSIHLLQKNSKVKAIVVYTNSGITALRVSAHSHHHPKQNCPIIALTFNEAAFKRLQIVWGVIPILLEKEFTRKVDLSEFSKDFLSTNKICTTGDAFVLVTGNYVQGEENTVKIIPM